MRVGLQERVDGQYELRVVHQAGTTYKVEEVEGKRASETTTSKLGDAGARSTLLRATTPDLANFSLRLRAHRQP